jgi:hypothetical protein
MVRAVTREQVVDRLAQLVKKHGSITSAASSLQISAQYLADAIGGRRLGPKILDAMGLERVETFRRKR